MTRPRYKNFKQLTTDLEKVQVALTMAIESAKWAHGELWKDGVRPPPVNDEPANKDAKDTRGRQKHGFVESDPTGRQVATLDSRTGEVRLNWRQKRNREKFEHALSILESKVVKQATDATNKFNEVLGDYRPRTVVQHQQQEMEDFNNERQARRDHHPVGTHYVTRGEENQQKELDRGGGYGRS